MDFNSGPKVPFPWGSGYWPVPFSSDEALQIAGLFHQVSFHFVVDMRQGESNIFQISTWKAFLLLKIYKNIFIMKNLTDFGKTVETGVDPCLPNSRA